MIDAKLMEELADYEEILKKRIAIRKKREEVASEVTMMLSDLETLIFRWKKDVAAREMELERKASEPRKWGNGGGEE